MADERSPYDFDDEHDDQGGELDFLTSEDFSGGGDLDELGDYPATDASDDDVAEQGAGVAPTETTSDDEPPMFTVTNPPGTVTVGTFMDGRVQHIDLSPKVATMTERDLADEILVVARLATQDARSAQYSYMLDGMTQQGHDVVATRDFLSRDLDLPSPEDAEAERARVFSTRYADDHE